MITITCDKCGKTEEIYPDELKEPNTLKYHENFNIERLGYIPRILCDNCETNFKLKVLPDAQKAFSNVIEEWINEKL